MRNIVSQIPSEGSILFAFDDNTVVWVVFQPTTVASKETSELARAIAQRFAESLPPGRWEGKIDGAGNVLESPVRV